MTKQIEIKQVFSIVEAVSNGTQISVLRNEHPKELTAIISSMIIGFQDSLNISEKMSEEQIVDCAYLISKEFGLYKIEELKMFFRDALTGKYGKVYKSIDVMTIFQMLENYRQQRVFELKKAKDKALNLSRKKRDEGKKYVPMPDEVKDKIKQIGGDPSLKEKFNEEDYRKFKIKELKPKK